MSRQLPARPNIEYHKNAAKALLKARRKGDIVANERVSGAHPRGASVDVTLRDAQWVIAREHGFATWAEFREHVVGCERRAVPDVASDAISSVLDITPEWLTRRLQGNGYLPRGRVSAVEVVSRDTPRSGVDRIAIAYTSDAPTAPARLLLKRTGGGDGATEVGFYTDIAPRMGVASTPVCYDAGIDHETRQAYVLVADHLDTHFLYRAPEHLAAPALESVVEELARIQAFWWDNERIHQNHYRNPMMMEADTPQALHRCCARLLDRAVPRFFDGPAVGAPPEWRGLCESAIAAWPAHMNERRAEGARLTFTHTNFHPHTFLLPRDAERDVPVIFHWNGLAGGLGVFSVAHPVLTSSMDREARHARTESLLHGYVAALRDNGVDGYSQEMCLQDLRLSIVANFDPFLQHEQPDFLRAAIEDYHHWGCAAEVGG